MPKLKAGDYRTAADRFDKTLLAKVGRGGSQELGVDELTFRANQPRKYIDLRELAALTESVREEGVKNPLHVRKLTQGGYEVLAGERRLRAARAAGLTRVPVITHDLSDEEAVRLAVLDNLHRADLNPIEETEAVLSLLEGALGLSREVTVAKLRAAANILKGRQPEGLLEGELATVQNVFERQVGRLTMLSFVQTRLPLLGLPSELYRAVLEGALPYTVAMPLKGVEDEVRRQALLQQAIDEGLSRTAVLALVREANTPPVSVRGLEAKVKPARRYLSGQQLRALPEAKRTDFLALVKEFVTRAEGLLEEKD